MGGKVLFYWFQLTKVYTTDILKAMFLPGIICESSISNKADEAETILLWSQARFFNYPYSFSPYPTKTGYQHLIQRFRQWIKYIVTKDKFESLAFKNSYPSQCHFQLKAYMKCNSNYRASKVTRDVLELVDSQGQRYVHIVHSSEMTVILHIFNQR